jgi:hypothetical protein
VQADLFIVEGGDPNAFAGLTHGRRMVGINVGMIKLIGESVDETRLCSGTSRRTGRKAMSTPARELWLAWV